MNRNVLLIGGLLTAGLVALLMSGLGRDPKHIDSPLVGKPAPTFALAEVGRTSETIDVARFRGKPLVINFWATWCGPCWEEHPVLNEAARAHEGRLQFLGVVFQDSEERITQFLRQRGHAYPTVVDQGGKTSIAYGVGGIPETFFLDANGVIVAKHDGPLSEEQLQKYLTEIQ